MTTSSECAVPATRFVPNEEGLKMALAAAKAALWEWQVDTDVHMWSDEVWPLYGLPTDRDASTTTWLDSIHPDDRQYARQTITVASQCRVPFEIEWRTNPANGAVRWILSRGQPIQARSEGRLTYTGIVMDITARKKSESEALKLTESLEERVKDRTNALSEHERLLQNILDSVPGLVGYWTRDLVNRFANKAYCDWFGKSADELRHSHIKDVLGPTLFAQNWPHINEALQGRPQRFECLLPVPSMPGEHRHADVHYLPDIADDTVQGFLVTVLDISQIKQAELAAESANQAKSEFLANISHEVRTPLNAMFGLAQVGARQAIGSPLAKTFDQILDSAQHLLSLVNDVLDFSKIESGKLNLHYERINLGQVLEHVLILKAIRAQAKGLPLIVRETPAVPQYFHGDATRLSQILLNLIGNAIKFTDIGAVSIQLDYVAPDLIVSVSDTGIGMSPEKQAQLFKPFVQVHGNHPAQTGGTGLGLAITKRLVEMMRGHIQVESQSGKGSNFTVKLPLMHPESGDVRGIRQVAVAGPPTDQRAALCEALSDRGCKAQPHDTLPKAADCTADVLVVASDSLTDDATESIRAHLAANRTVIVNAPACTTLELPEALQNELTVVAGPLSPLRLLNVIKTKLSRPAVIATQRLSNIRVLAAEDNPVNRLVLQQMLEQEGALVTFAFDGAHALEQVRVHGPACFDIVLCDIQMPIMDGYQTAQALGHIAPSLPVIGLTAHAFETAKQQARRSGMVGYVTKPYMLDTLVDEIRRFARRRPGEAAKLPPIDPNDKQASSTTPKKPKPTMQKDITDWQAMQQYFQAQPQLLERLIGMLGDTLVTIQQELEQAIEAGDLVTLSKVAHNIKGTALNLHTPELARLAVQTQEQARQQAPEALGTATTLLGKLRDFIELAQQRRT